MERCKENFLTNTSTQPLPVLLCFKTFFNVSTEETKVCLAQRTFLGELSSAALVQDVHVQSGPGETLGTTLHSGKRSTGCNPQPSQRTEPRSRSKVTSHSIHCGTVRKVPESCREVRDPPLGEQLLDPRVLADFLGDPVVPGTGGHRAAWPGGHGGAGTGHLGSWERNSEMGRGAGHLRVATVTAPKLQGLGKCPESWPVQLPQHRNKGCGVL